ncbi:MAG: TIGR04086 family membrane protein [Clostridia bacterium]|nr:TIGR04086 family membrane protein [Clostridia bacterium]
MKPLFWFKVIKGILFAALVSGALLGIFSFLGLRMDDPSAFATVFANVALFMGAFIGGGVASRGDESGILRALVCGVIYMGLILLPSLLFSSWEADSLLRAVLTVLASVIGALLFRRNRDAGHYKRSAKRRRRIASRYAR